MEILAETATSISVSMSIYGKKDAEYLKSPPGLGAVGVYHVFNRVFPPIKCNCNRGHISYDYSHPNTD